jgi:hypothetical protein
MHLKNIADLLVFLSLNITGIFLLFTVVLFFCNLFIRNKQESLAFTEFNYKLINRIVLIAILCTFFIAFIILGKDFFVFFENKWVIAIVVAGILNFIYAGWFKK